MWILEGRDRDRKREGLGSGKRGMRKEEEVEPQNIALIGKGGATEMRLKFLKDFLIACVNVVPYYVRFIR